MVKRRAVQVETVGITEWSKIAKFVSWSEFSGFDIYHDDPYRRRYCIRGVSTRRRKTSATDKDPGERLLYDSEIFTMPFDVRENEHITALVCKYYRAFLR